jgi:TonB family protein
MQISEFVQPVAFLPGLLLVIALVVVALVQGRQARSWLFPVAIPVSLLSVTCPIVTNAIVYTNAFQAIAATGSSGIQAIAEVSLSVCRSMLFGVLGLAACLCLIALAYVVVGPMRTGLAPAGLRPSSAALGLGFSLAAAVLTLGAGVMMWLQLSLIDTITLVTEPRTSQAAMEAAVGAGGGIAAVADRLSRIVLVLTLGGIPFSGLLVGVAVAAIVLLLRRQPARIGAFVTAGVLVVAGAGSVWAAVRLNVSTREINRVAIAAAAAQAEGLRDSAFQTPPPEPPPPPLPPDGTVGGVEGGIAGGVVGGVVGGVIGGLPEAPPPPPPPVAPVRVGGNVKQPVKTKDVQPVYPSIAQSARVQGSVIIEVTIGPNGRVQDARVLHGMPLLDQAALDAVRQWEYTPTLLNGVPVPMIMTVTVNFTLK